MNDPSSEPRDPAASNSHPPAIWFFFWGEFAERSCYYGMRAILFAYLTTGLLFTAGDANLIYFPFKMACYFLPLVGGIIADKWLGRYWTIVGFAVPYVVGQFLLALPDSAAQMFGISEKFALYSALILLAG